MASAQIPKVPPGANTKNPNEPFYFDPGGLDLQEDDADARSGKSQVSAGDRAS
jgi:hypothetical protein